MTTRLLFLQLFFLLFITQYALAQNGTVSGTIKDEKSALVGAVVFLESNKTIGTTTDINGKFILLNIPVGEQTFVITYLGYASQTKTITVSANRTAEFEVIMEGQDYTGEVVEISTQRRGQTQAINQQLASDKIANIVSSDKIQELPDVNAAEAIGRLPGVALSRSGGEGQKVIIRGLEPKFSAITVNGVRLPANSSTDRSVDLSMISPELLDAIEVFKSPLPDMDAEALAGTVNLRIKKAPEEQHMLARGLWGYNDISGEFKDYKFVLQGSRRFFNNKLGLIIQGNAERFNRSSDFVTNGWRRGRTDSTGFTEILGNSLTYQDRQEIRKRYNGSLSLDYSISAKHNIALFGVFSRTERDQFRTIEIYNPADRNITHRGQGVENILDLYSGNLTGDHTFKWFKADWSIASSRSNTGTPYNFELNFTDTKNNFDTDLNLDSHPKNYFEATTPTLEETSLRGAEFVENDAEENTFTALANITIPVKLGQKASLEFKFGGKYYNLDRERDYQQYNENFYYLGGQFTQDAINAYGEEGIVTLPSNNNLIGIGTFLNEGIGPEFVTEDDETINLTANFNENTFRRWNDVQSDNFSFNRNGLVNRYGVNETVTAAYVMAKLKVGDWLTVIPGFRYENSDNEYTGVSSTVSGRYGVIGESRDTTTFQKYDEILPHLHIKIKPVEWFDLRASYAQTLARPDFLWLTPRANVNNTALTVNAGNPNLQYSKSRNYDLHASFYDRILGLLTVGVFYKDISNTFLPWTIFLTDEETAIANGQPDFSGYELTSYTNLDEATVWGYEIDIQTNLSFLPKPFNGIVLSANYAKLFSETRTFFTTSETVLINPFPPIFETTYTTNEREVDLISQSPDIFHLSVGYDIKKFSARISGIFQGTRPSSYSLDEDFDRFRLEFWRWDASVKQGIGKYISVFLNINNFTNQQDISFTRTPATLNTVETYGMTGTLGLQFKL